MMMTRLTQRDVEGLRSVEQMLAKGDVGGAARLVAKMESRLKGNADFLVMAARVDRTIGKYESARKRLVEVLRQRPNEAICHQNLAMIDRAQGRVEEGIEAIGRALAIRPGDRLFLSIKAELLVWAGRHEEAMRAIEPMVESGNWSIGGASVFARIAPRFGRQREALGALETCLKDPQLAPTNRRGALFALAELLDQIGEYDSAFEALVKGHAISPAFWDPEAHRKDVDRMIGAWTREAIAAAPVSSVETDVPVFIVGMLRSGTSLLEQILACHPRFIGTGEQGELTRIVHELMNRVKSSAPVLHDLSVLRKQSTDRAARRYLDALLGAAGKSDGAERISDKNPLNYLHLGLISRLFPEARIIHCIRDPMDICISCYFHDFRGTGAFGHNLDHIAATYRDYRRLMEHWKSVLDLRCLDVVYERIVEDQEGVTREMLEFLDLPWNDGCMQFHMKTRITNTPSNDQVRRPMYRSSVGRWRNYAKQLEGIRGVVEGA